MKPKKGATSCSKKVVVGCPEKSSEDSCSKPLTSPCEESCPMSTASPCEESCPMSAASPCEESCSKSSENPCPDTCGSDSDEDLGKVTRNPFFNFLRDYRRCHKNISAKEIAMDGAEKWRCMSDQGKAKYIVQAFHTPKKYYRRRASMQKVESMDSMDAVESTESMESET